MARRTTSRSATQSTNSPATQAAPKPAFKPNTDEMWTNVHGVCRVNTRDFNGNLFSQTALYKKVNDEPFYFNIGIKFVNCPKLPEGTAWIDIKAGFIANDTYYSKKLRDYFETLSIIVTDYEVIA